MNEGDKTAKRWQVTAFAVAILIVAGILIYRSSSRSEAARFFDMIRYDVASIDLEWVAGAGETDSDNASKSPGSRKSASGGWMPDSAVQSHFVQNEAIDQIMTRLVGARTPGNVSMPATDAKLTLHLKNGNQIKLEISPPIARDRDGRFEPSPLNYLLLRYKQRPYVIDALPEEMVQDALRRLREERME